MIQAFARKVVDVRDDHELKGMLWATAYGFCILFSYYILRAVRDEISSADRGNLQLIWTAVFFVMVGAVVLYSWVTSRFQRSVFVPLVNRFFVACLIAFFAALQLLPVEARPWIDRVFYVWTSVFALFVVTVFWGFIVDCFSNDQGKRLFGFIAVGSSVGAIAGSALTASVAPLVPTFTLLLIACVPLEAASWCAWVLHRRFEGGMAADDADGGAGDGGGGKVQSQPLGGSSLSGIRIVFRSRYLLTIAGFLALMTFASTMLYFQQAFLVADAFADRGVRTAFFAKIDLAVNILTIAFQVYLTARIIRWIGIGASLALIPAVVAIGFLALGVMPLLVVLVVVQVIYRAGRYGITKPAREVLFTVLGREEKYKSKAFLDAAVYRGGDLVSGWIYAGLAAVGLSIGAIALVAVPFAAVWTVLGIGLGRKQEVLAEHGGPEAPAPATA